MIEWADCDGATWLATTFHLRCFSETEKSEEIVVVLGWADKENPAFSAAGSRFCCFSATGVFPGLSLARAASLQTIFHVILHVQFVRGAMMRAAHNPPRDGVQRYREKMRAQGFRAIQLWVPDTRSPGFAAECRRQSLLVAGKPEGEIMDDLEAALRDLEDWK